MKPAKNGRLAIEVHESPCPNPSIMVELQKTPADGVSAGVNPKATRTTAAARLGRPLPGRREFNLFVRPLRGTQSCVGAHPSCVAQPPSAVPIARRVYHSRPRLSALSRVAQPPSAVPIARRKAETIPGPSPTIANSRQASCEVADSLAAWPPGRTACT